MSRRAFLRTGLAFGAALAAGAAGLAYAYGVEPGWLQVVRQRIPIPRLPRAFDGVTIAQISDLHLGPYVGRERIEAAVDAVLALRPDVAVVTGDFVSRVSRGEPQMLLRALSRLKAPIGVFACLGNHDHWTDVEPVAEAVRRAGLTLLRNGNVAVRRGGQTIYLAGVDDVWEEQDDLGRALNGVPSDACVILLAHEPDFADEAARDGRVALQLSGHSHGGQGRIPGLGPVALPDHARRYPAGLYRVGDLHLYTNRGIGLVFPPLRLNCRPEVTAVELEAG